jgi:aspartyl-tRNA(Asn)/glutamyl-tRNA(Gln) amidotransferase subunit A
LSRAPAQQPRSAVATVGDSLGRIDQLDGRVGAFTHVLRERAQQAARVLDEATADRPATRPLHGVPVGVKDNIDTSGCPTTAGVRYRLAEPMPDDAPAIRRLQAAGAVVVGKTTMHELAFGGTSQNIGFGPCRNPWDLDRTPSGSSGGSAAAVAADIVPVALGTDTGGSVRNPAAVTGVTGLRPTPGGVPSRGVVPLAWSLDTIGILARRAIEVARVLDVIAGFDSADPHSRRVPRRTTADGLERLVDGVSVGIPSAFFFEGLEAGIESAVRAVADVLAAVGVELVEIELPGADTIFEETRPMLWAEGYAAVGDALRDHARELPDRVRERLEGGRRVTGAEYAVARERAREWCRTVAAAFDRVDVVLTPTTAATAPTVASCEAVEDTRQITRLTYPWSVSPGPSLSMPCGFDPNGLPIGAHLAGRPFEDDLILRLAAHYQAATEWHLARPAIAAEADSPTPIDRGG